MFGDCSDSYDPVWITSMMLLSAYANQLFPVWSTRHIFVPLKGFSFSVWLSVLFQCEIYSCTTLMSDGDNTPRPPADLLDEAREPDIDALEDDLTGDGFRAWRRKQQYKENLQNNKPQYNNGGYDTEELRHSPHTVDQCRRKQWYRENNAIQETQNPDGIFTIGTWIEESIIEPWIAALADKHGGYVANSLWLETTIETDVGEITIAGSSDPAIVDTDGTPHAITEVKSKQSLSNLENPSRHHKAQLHCYLYNAKEHYDLDDYPHGYIVYCGKKRLDVRVFQVDFDRELFNEHVLDWCQRLSYCRIETMLPAADPCQGWECKLCEYRGRCGNYDARDARNLPWEDLGADGMLPLFDYPLESVIEFMRANPTEEITPTVAVHHPGLVEVYDVADWKCTRCSKTFAWDAFKKWDGDVENPPFCPDCAEDDYWVDLSGPAPE